MYGKHCDDGQCPVCKSFIAIYHNQKPPLDSIQVL
jgi:hypothetical protein